MNSGGILNTHKGKDGKERKGSPPHGVQIGQRLRKLADAHESGVPEAAPPKSMRPVRNSQIVFDPITGKPTYRDLLPPDYILYPKLRARMISGQLRKRQILDMLGKDKRLDGLDAADKDVIAGAVSARRDDVGKNGKTLGDIVREEVERYLADKGNAPKIALQMDAEAGVRILELHFDNMFEHRYPEFEPAVAESKKATEAEVLAAIGAIPGSRLHEFAPSGITIIELLVQIMDYTIYDSVRKAVHEKLKN